MANKHFSISGIINVINGLILGLKGNIIKTKDSSTISVMNNTNNANVNLEALRFISTQTTGTAPLSIASTTVVSNLNVDLLDGVHSSGFATAAQGTLATNALPKSGGTMTGTINSTLAIGTAPITVTSTTKCTNLNADLLDDLNTATASTASTIVARDASGNITGKVLVSDIAQGTAPLTVTSTTKVNNLNADLLDGLNSTDFATAAQGTLATNAMPNTTTALGALEFSATLKATPVDADVIGYVDTEASNVLKKLTMADLKTYIESGGSGLTSEYAKITNLGGLGGW